MWSSNDLETDWSLADKLFQPAIIEGENQMLLCTLTPEEITLVVKGLKLVESSWPG